MIICLPEYYYADERIQKIILDKFQGILFAGCLRGDYSFYLFNKEKLTKSLSLNGSVMGKNLRCYIDEPVSNVSVDNINLDWILGKNPESIIGELEKNILIGLSKRYPKAKLTYTAYRELWFKIFGVRIPKPFSNQLTTWEWMEANFGERFSLCWINIDSNKRHYEKLIEWAKSHNKEIAFYVSLPLEKFIESIKTIKFNQQGV